MLERSFAPAYAAVYTDWGGEYLLVFGRLASGESIPSSHPSDFSEGTNLSLYSSYSNIESLQPASASDVPWANDAASITSVVFLEGVFPDSTAYWFNNMGSLSKFTGLDKIGMPVESTAHMFAGCEYVSELDLSWLNTKNASDMTGMFDGMTRLERITIGQNFSFTGDGSTTCSLPNGDWQAASNGAVYDASDVPGGLVETYVKQPSAYAAVYTDYDGEYALVFGKSCIVPSMYTADDGGLFFFVSDASWTGIEKSAYASSSEVPWLSGYASSITRAAVVDELSPVSTSLWFYDMANCASADLELLDVSKARSMRGMFYGCSALADVGDLSGWQTGSCEDMSYLFQACSALKSTGSLDGWDVSRVQDFTGTFANCSNLASVGDLSGWQTGACESMQAMFNNCSALGSVGDLDGWDVSNVADMSYMFYKCSYLASFGDLSSWRTSACTTMQSMFNGCTQVVTLDLSDWNVSSCQTMQTMFTGCINLVSVGDLSDWQTGSCLTMRGMFESCPSLYTIDLSGWDVSQVTDLGWLLHECHSLTSVGDLSSWRPSSCTNMKNLVYNCFELSSLGDLSSWNVSNVSCFAYAFAGYGGTMKLTTLGDISRWDTRSATDMTAMFQNCSSLSANCSTWSVSSVTSYDYFNTNSPGVTEPSKFTGGTGVV